ncbi:MAG: DUF4340 domain-containing protein, partial [Bdellovibrionales bacterium]|nr:DUF4340 domain-containing protein [Bdellovibrionales bacterium]
MGNSIKYLTGLVVVQLILVGILFQSSDSLDAFKPQEKLYEVAVDEVSKVVIQGKDQEKIELLKENDSWVLPESANFPVATNKLDTLVRGVLTSLRSYPVATTAHAHSQLDVSPSDFERHLQFYGGEKLLADVYLGSSPSFKKVHIRRADEDVVYVVALNAYEAGLKPNFWYDLNALKVKQDEVKAIRVSDAIVFERKDNSLMLAGLQEDEVANESEQASLIGRLLGQSFLENLGTTVDKEVADLKQVLSYEITLNDGT